MKDYDTVSVEFKLWGLEEIGEMLNDDDFLNMGEGETWDIDNYEVTCVQNETMWEYDDDAIPRNICFTVKVDGEYWDAIVEVTYKKDTLNSPAKLYDVRVEDFWIYEPIIRL